MSLSLQEAKEQIAKANGFKNWADLLVKEHLFEQYEYLHKAIDIVLSSKDKEIERLEILSKRNTDEYQKVVDEKVKEIAELKETITNFDKKQMYGLGKWYRALWEKSESELSKLKEEKDRLRDNTSNVKYTLDLKKQIQSLQEEKTKLNDIIRKDQISFVNQRGQLNTKIADLVDEMKKKGEGPLRFIEWAYSNQYNRYWGSDEPNRNKWYKQYSPPDRQYYTTKELYEFFLVQPTTKERQ